MKLKNEKGAVDKTQYGVLMDDSMSEEMKHPGLARPEDFEAIPPSEVPASNVDVHGIPRTGITGGRSASARPHYVEPPATPLTRTRPPKKSKK